VAHVIMEVSMEGSHKKVQVIITARDPDGSWSALILKTNKERGQFWQNVTGSVDEGESFEAAALREAQEETALDIEKIVDFLSLEIPFEFKDRWKKNVVEECFLVVAEEIWKPTIDAHEHENWKWVKLTDVTLDTFKYESNFIAIEKARKMVLRMGL